MLAGRVPFEGDSTLSIIYKQINDPPPPIPGISPDVQKVIDRALAKNPEDRYPTSCDMAVDFFLAIGMSEDAKTFNKVLPHEAKTEFTNQPDALSKSAAAFVKPKTAGRISTRIGIGILSVIGVLALAIGAFRILPKSSVLPKVTEVQALDNLAQTTETTPKASITPTAGVTSSIVDITPTMRITATEPLGLPDATGMVEVAAGSYEVGTSLADQYHSAVMNIELDGFWIDQYQITFEQYEQFLIVIDGQSSDVIGEGNHPVRGVTWEQAVAYCSWVNKRLPTEAEWEAAGRGPGPNPQIYPWGNDPNADGNVSSLPDLDTYEVGSLPFNRSPNGVYDLVGNIWEWVGEPYISTLDGAKILRGGRFGLPVLELSYRLPVTSGDKRYVKYAGFRCAADQVK